MVDKPKRKNVFGNRRPKRNPAAGMMTPWDILHENEEKRRKEEEEWASKCGPVTIRKIGDEKRATEN